MKIDFSYQFKYLGGKVMPERPAEITKDKTGTEISKSYPPFTLKTACAFVLLKNAYEELICPQCKTVIKERKDLKGKVKVKRFKLAKKIYNGPGHVDIAAKDIKLLKKLIAKEYPVLTVGQAWEILDPTADKD